MPSDLLARFLRPLRHGPVTRRYPDERTALPAAARALPELDAERCDATAACVAACPTAAISVTEAAWTVDAGRCVLCGACAVACPTDAIRLGSRFELASRTREGLRLATPIGRRE